MYTTSQLARQTSQHDRLKSALIQLQPELEKYRKTQHVE